MNDEMQRIIQELEETTSRYDETQNNYDCNVDLLKEILSKLGIANEMRNKGLESSSAYPTEIDQKNSWSRENRRCIIRKHQKSVGT